MSGAAPENDTATEEERRAAIMARLEEARAEKARAAELAPDMSKYGTHKKITCDGCAIEVITSPRHCLSFFLSYLTGLSQSECYCHITPSSPSSNC